MIVRMAAQTSEGVMQVLETEEIQMDLAPGLPIRIAGRTFVVVSRGMDIPETGPIVLAVLLREVA